MNKKIVLLQTFYPQLVRLMKNCNHHFDEIELNPYHLEGDVWTHTMMVCKQAETYNEAVQIAALLHDIGKVLCRQENFQKARASFFGHESVSCFVAIDMLLSGLITQVNGDLIRHICEIITLHTEPFKLTREELAKRMVNNHFLYRDLKLLNKADIEGRFKESVEEENPFLDLEEKEITKKTGPLCKMLIGLPGTGKTSIALKIKRSNSDIVVLSRDEILLELAQTSNYKEAFKTADHKKVDEVFNKRLVDAVKQKKNILVDKTNLSRKSRRRVLSYLSKDYIKEALVLQRGLNRIYTTNSNRVEKRIPHEVLVAMTKKFYPPLYDEFDYIEWSVN